LSEVRGFGEEMSQLHLPGFDTRFLLSRVLSPVTVLIELSGILLSRIIAIGTTYIDTQQDRQCTYNVTLRRVRVTIVTVENQ
jgi:hypothetical protein